MKYELSIEKSALKSLKKIPKRDQTKLITTIKSLAENPRPVGAKKLVGRNGWRIRFKDYRVIYEIIDKTCNILVLHIGNRKDIYKH
jgi:mRNA interferase RelE/StbE